MAKILQFQSELTCKQNDQVRNYKSNIVEVQVLPASTIVRPRPYILPQDGCLKPKRKNNYACLLLLFLMKG